MEKLKQRWQITSNFQLAVIFVVFAINGSLSAKIGLFLMNLIGFSKENINIVIYYIALTIIVTLIYPFLIIVNGFIFGQFTFFFRFAKNMLARIGLGFIFKTKKNLE